MSEDLTFLIKTLIWKWLQLCAVLRRYAGWHKSCREQSSLVLVPCEPEHVIGSRGDEAMIYAILADYRQRHADGRITVIVNNVSFKDSSNGQRLAKDFPGIEFCPAWIGHFHISKIYKSFICYKATEVYVVGADCMDGYYESAVSFTLLACADLSMRLGLDTKLTGFSFNNCPTKPVYRMFRHASSKLVLNVRDPISLERVNSLGYKHLTTRLVADVAFKLKPVVSEIVANIGKWTDGERNKGQTILAFNLHGMLVSKEGYEGLVRKVSNELLSFIEQNKKVSVLLVPHDYRPQGDLDALNRISEFLSSSRVRLVKELLSAAELKGLMGYVDCLFTSRMHLGIAALGMGKPVASFSYQGKFQGLFKLFGLPLENILAPEDIAHLHDTLKSIVGSNIQFSQVVKSRLKRIFELASMNLNDR